MITYVNTVFVSNNASAGFIDRSAFNAITSATVAANKGKFVVLDYNDGSIMSDTAHLLAGGGSHPVEKIKIGILTGKMQKDHKGNEKPEVRWSNVIYKYNIKSVSELIAPATTNTEDVVTVDFTGIDPSVLSKLAEGGKRVIVRLTFKDLPTRFRKWTESYEYVTQVGDDDADLAENIATLINKQWKRARVTADGTTTAGQLVLTAMPYDDDDSVDTINWANKVRFNANIYYTDPAAEGWESLNKFFPTGVTITKVPGFRYAADAKLVRDRESQAMGYLGVLNRGEGTWPIIKPAMETDINARYDAITIEFESPYRAADDIFRKTKEAVEIYVPAGKGADMYTKIAYFTSSTSNIDFSHQDVETEDGQ